MGQNIYLSSDMSDMSDQEEIDLADILPQEISLDLPTQMLSWVTYRVPYVGPDGLLCHHFQSNLCFVAQLSTLNADRNSWKWTESWMCSSPFLVHQQKTWFDTLQGRPGQASTLLSSFEALNNEFQRYIALLTKKLESVMF